MAHYALVWDQNGIAGVDNGTRNVAVFLDGQLNSSRWYTLGGADFIPFADGQLSLVVPFLQTGESVAIDQIKIWDFAKTDFSDRFEAGPGEIPVALAPSPQHQLTTMWGEIKRR
ncbi:hypothetical protein HYR99_35900 [Candidatus Poribacteria bacterium]|nr:hypothetical protein [Candidatus Poribacteria bacterium]